MNDRVSHEDIRIGDILELNDMQCEAALMNAEHKKNVARIKKFAGADQDDYIVRIGSLGEFAYWHPTRATPYWLEDDLIHQDCLMSDGLSIDIKTTYCKCATTDKGDFPCLLLKYYKTLSTTARVLVLMQARGVVSELDDDRWQVKNPTFVPNEFRFLGAARKSEILSRSRFTTRTFNGKKVPIYEIPHTELRDLLEVLEEERLSEVDFEAERRKMSVIVHCAPSYDLTDIKIAGVATESDQSFASAGEHHAADESDSVPSVQVGYRVARFVNELSRINETTSALIAQAEITVFEGSRLDFYFDRTIEELAQSVFKDSVIEDVTQALGNSFKIKTTFLFKDKFKLQKYLTKMA